MKPLIYIAGPMAGKEDFNRAAFNAAAKVLAAKGWQPINPVEIERLYPCVREDGSVNGVRLNNLMEIERIFVRRADAMYLLNGWERSKGAWGELEAFAENRFLRNVYLEVNGGDDVPDVNGRGD